MLSLCAMVLILFGMMALMNLVTSEAVPESMATLVGRTDNPLSTGMQHSEAYQRFKKAMLVPTLLAGMLGIGAGIGLLQGREGARKAGIAWASIYLIMGFAAAGVNIVCARSVIDKMELPPAVKPEMEEALRTALMNSVLVSAVFTTVFVLALAVLMVVMLTRRDAVAFCTMKPFGAPSPSKR